MYLFCEYNVSKEKKGGGGEEQLGAVRARRQRGAVPII